MSQRQRKRGKRGSVEGLEYDSRATDLAKTPKTSVPKGSAADTSVGSVSQPPQITPCAENNRRLESIVGDGISMGDIAKLTASGFQTIESIAYAAKKKIVCVKGISEIKAERIMEKCRNLTTGLGFSPASLILTKRNEMIRIKTGSLELDALLGGGIETGSITEIYGASGTGKTFFCHQMAINSLLPVDVGGAEGKTVFIDTAKSFRTQRLIACGNKHGLDAKTSMDGVIYARGYNNDHVLELILQASAYIARNRCGLLILDSAMKLLRVEFAGRGDLAERQLLLGIILRHLKSLAEQYGIAIIITNEVVANVDGANAAYGPAYKAVGGHVLAHQVVTRLHIKKGRMGSHSEDREESIDARSGM